MLVWALPLAQYVAYPDAWKDRIQEEKGRTEDEMAGWHHRLNGHEFEQALGVGADTCLGEVSSALQSLERNPQLSLATRGEDWASQGQPKGKAEIPVVTRESRRNSRKTTWFHLLAR